ncbi:MAG: response regulator [Allomuricauda sp.]|nr:MAG: response regulator [Allomuricauda sp.]
MHRLLKRQLDKAGFEPGKIEEMKVFLEQISHAYQSFEQDYGHLEHVLEQSSKELFTANQSLKNKVKTVEGKLSKVATNIRDIIFEMDVEGRWTYLNSAWERMSGHTVEASLGNKYYEYLPKEVTEPFRKKVVSTKGVFKLHRASFQYTKPDGEVIWLDVSIKPIIGATDKIEGFIGSISDITELKHTEEKLIQANKAKDQFLSVMSHEIRTPLNAVIGVSNLLLMEDPKPSQMENLDVLGYSSKHLLALVNDILDYNKIVSGSLVMEQDEFSLVDTLHAQKQMFQQRASTKGLKIEIDLAENVPKTVVGDTHRLSQILTNLLGNAIKFTKKGFVKLEVSLKEKGNNINLIQFKVIDTGVGIPKNKLKKIFEPFAQASSKTTRLYGGTGLGLAISKNLVELMGSTLACESKPGKGSTFTFTVPFESPGVQSQSRILCELPLPNKPEYSSLNGMTILVVEDNKINATILNKFLSKWGVRCEVAENGLVGFEMSVKKKYDLIFMDIEMPIMNGYQSTLAIRETKKNPNHATPIIALTASTGDKTGYELSKCGMDGLIPKPFDPKELFVAIESSINATGQTNTIHAS